MLIYIISDDSNSESDISEELTDSEEDSEGESGTEVDSESEPKAPLPPPQIPTIVIHESPPQDIDLDQKWDSQESTKPEIPQNLPNVENVASADICDNEAVEEKVINDERTPMSTKVSKVADDGKFDDTDKNFNFCFRMEKEELPKTKISEKRMPVIAPLATEESSSDMSISSGVNSLAREIVADVIEAAKETMLERKQHEIQNEVLKDDTVVDLRSEKSTSTSQSEKSAKYAVLNSLSSPGEAKVLVVDLCSPEQIKPAMDISVIDLCSPTSPNSAILNENFEVTKDDKSNLSAVKNENVSKVPLFDLKTSEFEEDDSILDETADKTLKSIQKQENLDQTIVLDDSIENAQEAVCEELLNTPDQEKKFDESFVTTRKRRKHSKTEVFNWDDEDNVSIPLCYNASFLPEEDMNLSLDGIYRANLVQAVDSGSTDQLDVESKETTFNIRQPDSFVTENSDVPLEPVVKDVLSSDIQSSSINMPKEPSIMPINTSCNVKDAKLSASVPKNAVLPASPIKSPIEDENEYNQTVSDMKDSVSEGISDKICDKYTEKSSPKTLSVTNDDKPKVSSKEEVKYKGYSGSFAEKVRPKSLFCDTLYLRSLDIKLKQPFSPLNKSDDKLDDYSKTEYEERIKRKLFSDSNDSLDIDEKDNDVFENPDEKNFENINNRKVNELCAVEKAPVCIKNSAGNSTSNIVKPKASAHKHPSVSFSALDARSDLVSPYTSAQVTSENSFPTKMRPKCDMDISKLRQKREKRKSVHEDIQGLPFADEEKIVSPVDPFGNSEVFMTPRANFSENSRNLSSSPNEVFSTPTGKTPGVVDEERYLRLQSTAEQEKARQEARARARLKSDEELGLSPNNYRKKYRRQLSLNSINYDELNSDEFCDQDDDDLDDDIINNFNFCPNKDSGIEETFNIFKNTDFYLKGKSAETSISSQPQEPKVVKTALKDMPLLTPSSPHPSKAMSASTDTLKFSDSQTQNDVTKNLMQTSMHSSKTSSPETSPDVICAETPSFDSKFSNKTKGKTGRTESSGDDDKSKSNGKKSIFSILNFGKGNVSKEKPKQKPKDSEKELSSSLPNDFGARSVSKSKPFSHLKLSKSKEKASKPKAKSVPSEDVPNCPLDTTPVQEDPLTVSLNTHQAKIIPKYTVYRNPETMISTFPVHLPVPKMENGLAPKASGKLEVCSICFIPTDWFLQPLLFFSSGNLFFTFFFAFAMFHIFSMLHVAFSFFKN